MSKLSPMRSAVASSFLTLCLLALPIHAAVFKIDHIEFRKGVGFLIHFDTEPNWTYHLQSINRLNCVTNVGCSRFGVQTNAWNTIETRSEERRVGKECRSRWSPDH